MGLQDALGVSPGQLVAFVGAGGKTSAAWRLLRDLAAEGHPTVFTTTTRVFEPLDVPLLLSPDPSPIAVMEALGEPPLLVLAARRGEQGDPAQAARSVYPARSVKLVGLEPERVEGLARSLPGLTWLVEADGARGRELKAPAEYEPVIPRTADRVLLLAGLEALGRPLDECTVHRPERASRLLGMPLGASITPQTVVALLTDPRGGMKGIPASATVVAVLNQRGQAPHPHAATIARGLLREGRISRVVLADLHSREPVLEVWG